jgi:hypothetical protein
MEDAAPAATTADRRRRDVGVVAVVPGRMAPGDAWVTMIVVEENRGTAGVVIGDAVIDGVDGATVVTTGANVAIGPSIGETEFRRRSPNIGSAFAVKCDDGRRREPVCGRFTNALLSQYAASVQANNRAQGAMTILLTRKRR